MRKIYVIFFSFVVIGLPMLVFAASPTLDGHFWKKTDMGGKGAIIAGFMDGYRYGRIQGTMDSVETVSETFSKNPPCPEREAECATITSVLFALMRATRAALNKRGSEHTYGWHVNEVDAFYKTFPFCQRREIFSLLSDLMEVWQDGKKSYKEIGEECQKLPK